MVLLEAMAARTAIVASDIDAFRRVLAGGRAGRQFTSGDPAALAAALAEVLADAPLRDRLVAAGDDAVAPYDWTVIVAEVLRVYELAIAGAGVGA